MLDTSVFREGLLDGQVALVTGGGTGIGLGISELLASLGAHVVLASRKPEHLDPAVASIVAAGGTRLVGGGGRARPGARPRDGRRGRVDARTDRRAREQRRRQLLRAVAKRCRRTPGSSVVEIDLYGTFFCSQAVMPVMKAQGGGRIVSISMTLHYRGWPQMAHATAAKAGVDALTRTLAVEWAPYGIRVNAIAPGPIPTEGVRKAFTPPRRAAVCPTCSRRRTRRWRRTRSA